MFLPFKDDNPHTITPYVNYSVIAACVLVYLWQFSLGPQGGQAAVYVFGFTPGLLFGDAQLDPRLPEVPQLMTVFSSMFMHGGFMHLGGNMLYLWIFGDNIEASLGHMRYLAFYLVCGVIAAFSHGLAAPLTDIPMVGASGAVSGILGAYLVLHPRANIRVFVVLIIFFTVINLPAFIVLGFWFGGQLLSSMTADPSAPGVAFLAHIGGFVAGALLVFFFKKRGVSAFDKPRSRAFAAEHRPIRVRRGGSVPRTGKKGPWG
jgi:membrane associated rhomboid family serine protease